MERGEVKPTPATVGPYQPADVRVEKARIGVRLDLENSKSSPTPISLPVDGSAERGQDGPDERRQTSHIRRQTVTPDNGVARRPVPRNAQRRGLMSDV